jgi:hypothetical protein
MVRPQAVRILMYARRGVNVVAHSYWRNTRFT